METKQTGQMKSVSVFRELEARSGVQAERPVGTKPFKKFKIQNKRLKYKMEMLLTGSLPWSGNGWNKAIQFVREIKM